MKTMKPNGKSKAKISVILPVYNVEHYLKETLRSVQQQTFSFFEVIMVNDGSEDGSLAIMEEFSRKDSRFHSYTQENQGVSAARNRGIEEAQGEYVLFVDGDDILPKDALEKLYRKGREKQADMVIGGMQEFGIYGQPVYKKIEELTADEDIDRYDPRLIWTFSVCNKLMKKRVIDQYHLRFERVKFTEDGLFFFNYLFRCCGIAGCNAVVYQYRKRPFWEEASATQMATADYFRDLQTALDAMIEVVETYKKTELAKFSQCAVGTAQYVETEVKLNLFIEELYDKIIEVSLLNQFYRQAWKSDDNLLELLNQSMEKYKSKIFPSMWNEIQKTHADLRLGQKLLNKRELAEDPLISVVVSNRYPAEQINLLLVSLYGQSFPAFKVYVHGSFEQHVEPGYKKKENIVFCKGSLPFEEFKQQMLEEIQSPYVTFIDEPMYVNVNAYKKMYDCLEEDKNAVFCSCKIKILKGDSTSKCAPHDITFFQTYLDLDRKTRYHNFDWFMGNKLFRTEMLRNASFVFSSNPVRDIRKCYRKFHFSNIGTAYMLMLMSQKKILHTAKGIVIKFTWRIRYKWELFKMPSARESLHKKIQTFKDKISSKVKQTLFSLLPIQKKVLFVSVRGNHLLENSQAVYDAYHGKKSVFSHLFPHSRKDRHRLYRQLFTSKVIVTDDYLKYLRMFRLKKKQKVIQIWHACGAFKKFGLDNPAADIQTELKTHKQYDTVVVSAEGIREQYAEAFGISVDKVRALGVPRTDKLLDPDFLNREKQAFYEKHPDLKGKRILLYAPTFREYRMKRIRLDPKLDYQQVSETIGEDTVLIIKNHPLMKYDLLKGKTYPNIINMPDENTSRLMIVCEVLITDYSSVIFEAALLNKPAIFYCPDFQTYERDFYLDFPEDLYGEFTESQDELLQAIRHLKGQTEIKGLEEFKNRFMGSCDGHSAERVAALIAEKLKER